MGQTSLYESRAGEVYSSVAYPQEISYYHSIQYYDDFSFAGASLYLYTASNKTKGLLTGSQITVLGTGGMLLSVNYYDEEGRLAKVYKQHYQSGGIKSGNYDEISNSYNFKGVLTASNRIHHNASTRGSATIVHRYDYDHMGRTLRTFEQIDRGIVVLLAKHS
jgi:hypothetical protein